MSGPVHTAARRLEVVVVAASAGVVPLYGDIFGPLDRGLAVPVVLAQHRARGDDLVRELLARQTGLEVVDASCNGPLRAGSLYVCPADAQLRFTRRGGVVLCPVPDDGSVTADAVLVSSAAMYGPAVLAVVLSGRLRDGAVGVRAVKHAGGRVIVQDPRTAAYQSMPAAALATGCVDACLPPRSIADAIRAFVAVPGAAALFATRPAPWAWHAA